MLHTMSKYTFFIVSFIPNNVDEAKFPMVLDCGNHCGVLVLVLPRLDKADCGKLLALLARLDAEDRGEVLILLLPAVILKFLTATPNLT